MSQNYGKHMDNGVVENCCSADKKTKRLDETEGRVSVIQRQWASTHCDNIRAKSGPFAIDNKRK